jgi:hypothetical protein
MEYDMTYVDEDGDQITIASAQDFLYCIDCFKPKIPKISLKKREGGESDISFTNVQLTVSTVDRPPKRKQEVDQKEKIAEQNESSINDDSKQEEVKFNATDYDVVDSSKEASVQEEEKSCVRESDEKATSTKNIEIPTETSAVQTHPVDNANVSTDVANLVSNHDEQMNTEITETEDKSSQNIVDVVDTGLNPVPSKDLKISQDFNAQSNMMVDKQQEPEEDEALEDKLREIVKDQIDNMTPRIMEECQKYLENKLSENEKIDVQNTSEHDATC